MRNYAGSNGAGRDWGHMQTFNPRKPPAIPLIYRVGPETMGIKAKGYMDKHGKFHIPIISTSQSNIKKKRSPEVIPVDSDGVHSYDAG